MNWCDYSWSIPSTLNGFFQLSDLFAHGHVQRKVWYLAIYAVLWFIWRARNNLVFNNITPIWDNILCLTFHRIAYWVKSIDETFVCTGNDSIKSSEVVKSYKYMAYNDFEKPELGHFQMECWWFCFWEASNFRHWRCPQRSWGEVPLHFFLCPLALSSPMRLKCWQSRGLWRLVLLSLLQIRFFGFSNPIPWMQLNGWG